MSIVVPTPLTVTEPPTSGVLGKPIARIFEFICHMKYCGPGNPGTKV